MDAAIARKLEKLAERHEEISRLLSAPEVLQDSTKFRDFSKEYSEISPVVEGFKRYQQAESERIYAETLCQDKDPELQAMGKEELQQAKEKLTQLDEELKILLIPKDPKDQANVFLEIRAGAGGDEAAIFAGNLFRMYSRYAETQGWQVEVINRNDSEQGGVKEIIARMSGKNVYGRLKFESGAHRVQRVPVTEAQGRIHTSTCTVAIMPEADEVEAITINPADLRIDTYRSSGAGGQHVNKTESAIRITHLPTGVVVECQEERSQHKNRARAMSLLQARLMQAEVDKQSANQAATRRELVGTGDRSERIRTYNYPQGRLTDHRINLTLYKLEDILEGDLTPVIDPLLREYQADQLSRLQET